MSGEIINPFSSDFKKSSSTFSSESIPVVAYALIGITSLTLAYLTLVESTQGDVTAPKQQSATSMLPNIGSSQPSVQRQASPTPVPAEAVPVSQSVPMAEAVPVTEDRKSLGGKNKSKGKRKRVHKKTVKKV